MRRVVCLLIGVMLCGVTSLATAQQMPSIDSMMEQLQQEQGIDGQLGATPTLPGLNATKQVMTNYKALTPKQEYWLGRSVGAMILGQYKPYPGAKANKYANLLGRTLAAASAMPETYAGYRFLILDSDDINALAAPGGFIFITKGLIRCCPHEEALAAVLAHEIGHIEKQHGLQAIKQARIHSALTGVAMEGLKEQAGEQMAQLLKSFEGSINDVFKTLVVAGYSRKAEAEADVAAVTILQRVGYPPSGLVDMLMAMEDRLDPKGTDFARTHPSPINRYKMLKRTAPFEYQEVQTTPARKARFQDALGEILSAQ